MNINVNEKEYMQLTEVKKRLKSGAYVTPSKLNRLIKPIHMFNKWLYLRKDVELLARLIEEKKIIVNWLANNIYVKLKNTQNYMISENLDNEE